jgi:hypothetical protein
VDGRIILKWIFKKTGLESVEWIAFMWLRWGTGVGVEHSNESSGSIKGEELLN